MSMVTFASALCAPRRVSKHLLTSMLLNTVRPFEFIYVYKPCVNHSAAKITLEVQVTPTASTCLAAIRHGHGVVLRTAILTDQLFL